MPERRQPEFDPDAAVRAVADGLPDIETPIIHIEDLEPKPQLKTPVDKAGVKTQHASENQVSDEAMLADDEQTVRDALAEFEREYEKLRSS